MVVRHCYVSDEKTGLLSIISASCKEESILECKKCTCLFGMEKAEWPDFHPCNPNNCLPQNLSSILCVSYRELLVVYDIKFPALPNPH